MMNAYHRPLRLNAGLLLPACAVVLLPATRVVADGTVSGQCRFEQIKGRNIWYTNLHEWNAFLIPNWSMFANPLSYRVDHGNYTFTNPAGNYTIYVNQPEFFGRAKVVRNVQLTDGQTATVHPSLNLDYSCFYKSDWPSGWGTPWYQTFIATGTSINKIAYSCASGDTGTINVSLLKDTGGNVTTWSQVGVTKSSGSSIGESWVGYLSGQLPTVPGERYAIRLAGQGGTAFSPFWRTDNGDGYAGGQAFDPDGIPLNKDLCVLVFSDNDGTILPYMKTTGGMGTRTWWEWQWGQTFKATGEALAAVDLWISHGGDLQWNMRTEVKVYSNPPAGDPPTPSGLVGLVKRGRGAWQAGGAAMIGAGYEPGEVPLVTGNTYYIEITPYGGDAIGYEAYRFDQPADAYPHGHAYSNRYPRPDIDLSMTIMEYAVSGPPPQIERSPAFFTRSVERGKDLPHDIFTVRNAGGGAMSYTISDDVGWLSVAPDGGTSSGEADPINIAYSTSTLAIGPYTGTITISAPGATNPTETVVVYLTVTPPLFARCDFDIDHDVDQSDFGRFQACLSGPGVPQLDLACDGADLDNDDDVDKDDFALFRGCLSGPDVEADTLCAG
jgi:hypothetical protein